jgi:hypothetical protein
MAGLIPAVLLLGVRTVGIGGESSRGGRIAVDGRVGWNGERRKSLTGIALVPSGGTWLRERRE